VLVTQGLLLLVALALPVTLPWLRRRLLRAFGDVVQILPATRSERGWFLAVALTAGICEELLFRGALLPWLGHVPQALIFALLHVGPSRRFLPWTVSALVLGLGFGFLATETGSLGGPIAAHFTINFLNLRFIVRPESRDLH
jgi:membrane protease YdiL (CAAX protease family)